MTRENKLSIVIAFGLLIFVGMLVADHYSVASHREVAPLGSNAPTPPLLNSGRLVDGPPPSAPVQHPESTTGDMMYTVRKGETLRSICSAYYGDSGLASAVARDNNMPNPDDLEEGQTIALRTRASLFNGSFLPAEQTRVATRTPKKSTPKMGSYTVQPGDTLSELAGELMGTLKKTNFEKTTELFNYNRDVMPDRDTIVPGMILQYPKYARRDP